MHKKWTKWNEQYLINSNEKGFINSLKFKLTIFSFLIIFTVIINLKLIESLKRSKKTIVLFSDNKDLINLSHQNIAISS